jgi:hypothetical protein
MPSHFEIIRKMPLVSFEGNSLNANKNGLSTQQKNIPNQTEANRPLQSYYFECEEGSRHHVSPTNFEQHLNLDSLKSHYNGIYPYWHWYTSMTIHTKEFELDMAKYLMHNIKSNA